MLPLKILSDRVNKSFQSLVIKEISQRESNQDCLDDSLLRNVLDYRNVRYAIKYTEHHGNVINKSNSIVPLTDWWGNSTSLRNRSILNVWFNSKSIVSRDRFNIISICWCTRRYSCTYFGGGSNLIKRTPFEIKFKLSSELRK